MKKINSILTGLAATFATGLVFACATLPFPVMRISVSLWDIGVATIQGHQNPALAAFMANVDDAGEQAFGADVWRANNFVGRALLTTSVLGMNGGQIVVIDKPCDKMVVDSLPPTSSNNSGGSGGAPVQSGTLTYGVIGFRPVYRTGQVCTEGVCSSTTVFVGYEPIYGYYHTQLEP